MGLSCGLSSLLHAAFCGFLSSFWEVDGDWCQLVWLERPNHRFSASQAQAEARRRSGPPEEILVRSVVEFPAPKDPPGALVMILDDDIS